jgi:glycosyltransferase involved in cell wall biosynthesis
VVFLGIIQDPIGVPREGGECRTGSPSFRGTPISRVAKDHVLYFCIPSYNEAPTIGLLLWRLRKVFQEQPREYEVMVYDDGSTDATTDTLAPYHKVMPLTVLGGTKVGYPTAVDALCREASRRTRYPRRDAIVLLQADFTDQPENLPELIKRFDGGADVVVAERPVDATTVPQQVRTLRRMAPWVVRPFVSVAGVRDPFATLRLFRVSVIRDLIKERGEHPLLVGDGWSANVDLLLRAAPLARRIETVELAPRYGVRARETRVRAWSDAMSLFRFARSARGRSVRATRA